MGVHSLGYMGVDRLYAQVIVDALMDFSINQSEKTCVVEVFDGDILTVSFREENGQTIL